MKQEYQTEPNLGRNNFYGYAHAEEIRNKALAKGYECTSIRESQSCGVFFWYFDVKVNKQVLVPFRSNLVKCCNLLMML